MGKWHDSYKMAYVVKQIQNDVPLFDIYLKERQNHWTKATKFCSWFNNTTDRLWKFFSKSLQDLIPSNTINNRKYLIRKNMSKKKDEATIEQEIKDALDKIDREDLYKIIRIYQKHIQEIEEEKSKKNNRKCSLLKEIKLNCKNISTTTLTTIIQINRRTWYRNKDKDIYIRKIRSDAKFNNLYFVATINKIFNEHKSCAGSNKISILAKKDGVNISQKTALKIMNNSHLYVKFRLSNKWKHKEIKLTKLDMPYLINDQVINDAKPNEIISADFSQIKTKDGVVNLHVMLDVKTQKVHEWSLTEDQKSSVVLNQISKINGVKILNSDHGRQYFDKDLLEYLTKNNIQSSMGEVGKSVDNRWVEYFFGCLKSEFLSQYSTIHLSSSQVRRLIKEYIEYYNNKRINSKLNWLSPVQFEKTFFI